MIQTSPEPYFAERDILETRRVRITMTAKYIHNRHVNPAPGDEQDRVPWLQQ